MKIKLFAIIALISIFLVGCTGGGSEGISKTDPFIGGTTGIAINFAEGSPPAEVFDAGNYPFDIVVTLENKGEYTVPKEDVLVTISGILPSQFDVTESQLSTNPEEDLESTRKDSEGDVIKGPPVYVTFDGLNHKDKLEGNQQFPIRADVCYTYENQAVSHICVLKDNIDPEKDAVCKVNEAKNTWNSGGPVQVTNFKEDPRSKNKVGFSFKVTHSGTGLIYRHESTCSEEVKTDEDKVWVEVESEADGTLRCSGLSGGSDTTGYVRLYGGDILVMCTLEVNTNAAYQTPVDIKLRYDYKQVQSANILVKHAPDDE